MRYGNESYVYYIKEMTPMQFVLQVCAAGHLLYNWCSQPVLNRRLHSGDLQISAAILLSGNNYSKISLMARFLQLQFVSVSVFQRIQRTYLVPAIENFWEERQSELLGDLKDEQLVLLGKYFIEIVSSNCLFTQLFEEKHQINSSRKILEFIH